jgi:hypothetical protein
VFARVIAGESLATIAAWLGEQTGREWWPRTIGGMIRNPVYRGTQQNAAGQVIHRVDEPLIDASTFKRANDALDTRPKRGPSNPQTRAMLSGALFCPRCADSPMYRVVSGRGASRTAYYRCTGRGANRRSCGNMVRVELADAAVDRIIARYFDTPVMAHVIVPGNEAELAARLDEVQFEIRQLAAEDLGDDEFDRRLAGLRAERDRIKAIPVRPDRVELTGTGERYSQLWEATPAAARGPWLARHGFRVCASRTGVTVEQGQATATISL